MSKVNPEQIESVGGRFIEVDGMDDFEDESGYAKPLTPRIHSEGERHGLWRLPMPISSSWRTAVSFLRPAPITVPSNAVANFKSGAVVVDMNADVGGNCEDTVQEKSPPLKTASSSLEPQIYPELSLTRPQCCIQTTSRPSLHPS